MNAVLITLEMNQKQLMQAPPFPTGANRNDSITAGQRDEDGYRCYVNVTCSEYIFLKMNV